MTIVPATTNTLFPGRESGAAIVTPANHHREIATHNTSPTAAPITTESSHNRAVPPSAHRWAQTPVHVAAIDTDLSGTMKINYIDPAMKDTTIGFGDMSSYILPIMLKTNLKSTRVRNLRGEYVPSRGKINTGRSMFMGMIEANGYIISVSSLIAFKKEPTKKHLGDYYITYDESN
jgi:hypothetical protein